MYHGVDLSDGYDVFEEPVGLIQRTDTTEANAFISSTQGGFIRLALPLENCPGPGV